MDYAFVGGFSKVVCFSPNASACRKLADKQQLNRFQLGVGGGGREMGAIQMYIIYRIPIYFTPPCLPCQRDYIKFNSIWMNLSFCCTKQLPSVIRITRESLERPTRKKPNYFYPENVSIILQSAVVVQPRHTLNSS